MSSDALVPRVGGTGLVVRGGGGRERRVRSGELRGTISTEGAREKGANQCSLVQQPRVNEASLFAK